MRVTFVILPGLSPREIGVLSKEPNRKSRSVWLPSPEKLLISEERVDVWRVRLDQTGKASFPDSILAADEIARADRFHFEKDRLKFVRCRIALRDLLSKYMAIRAGEIRFEYQLGGKPQLSQKQNSRKVEFNVSHSGDIALIAVGAKQRLGVDVERIRDGIDTSSLAERFFSARERAGLRALPEKLRLQAFYACWTRKEAFLKATGDGLSFPLADFSVTTDPTGNPELEEIHGDFDPCNKWALADLCVGGGYRATVAGETLYALETYDWH